MNEQDLLKALREHDASESASPASEAALLAAFRSHHARGKKNARPRVYAWWAAAAAACIVLAATVPVLRQRVMRQPAVESPAPEVVRVEPRAPVPVTVSQPPAAHHMVANARPRRRPRVVNAAPQVVAAQAPAEREQATDFLPIPAAPALVPGDRGQILRVRMPQSSLRALGVPVHEDRWGQQVRADVLMGEDGIARAVRFVR